MSVTPSEVGPLTVRVELVFESGEGELIGRDVVEHEVVVTTGRSFPSATVVVDGREYRVSGEADSRGVPEYLVEDVENSARVGGLLRDKAIFTAHVQHVYRTPGSIRQTRFFGSSLFDLWDDATYFGIWISSDVTFGLGASTGITSILISPNAYWRVKSAANLSVDVVTKMIKEMTDNPEKTTEEVGLKAIRESRDLLKEVANLAKEIEGGRPLSFAEAVFIEDADTYGASYQGPAVDALLMIAKENLRIPEETLKTAGAVATEHLSGLPATDALELVEVLSVLEGLNDPLAEYEPWQVMASGTEANLAAERVKHAKLLDSMGISDHEPFQLPVLTGFTITAIPPTAPTAAPAPTPAPTATPATPSGRIVFHSSRDGNYEIYVMNADGSDITRLTHNSVRDYGPSLSPDGRRIAFQSWRDDNEDIYVMNADGSDVTRLTENEAADYGPIWSPDGRRIAFTSDRDGNGEIYVMNADGSGQTRLTDNPAADYAPSWSPDGQRIAFGSYRDGEDIYVMNADGSGQTRLTDGPMPNGTPSWSPDGRRIAFESWRDWNWEIYVMNADGSGQTRLTDNPATDYAPIWLPDGRRIAFMSIVRDSNKDIYVMNADGSGQTRLTDNPATDGAPIWLPDGRLIAFESYRDENRDIYVMNADGSGQTRLTDNEVRGRELSWSPDGRRIAFQSWRDDNEDIYVMNADGSDITRLTHNEAYDYGPSLSPDGQRIAFSSDRDGGGIYVMNIDGSDVTRLTDNEAYDSDPSWSPDGRRIAFESNRDDPVRSDDRLIFNIYVMNADGSGQTRLTDNPGSDSDPSWSPDGQRIAFSSDRDGNGDIYVMNTDGSDVTRLTDNPGFDSDPSWSPDGRRIAFSSYRGRDADIFVMNADGSGVKRLVDSPATDGSPSWSMDSR